MKRQQKRSKNILIKIKKLEGFTEFEKKVYKAILKIPKGQTRTYEWVAREIKSPRSSRAVGNALNKNPYPVIVPCHRIIRKNGKLGGFAKGVSIKKKLLVREGVKL